MIEKISYYRPEYESNCIVCNMSPTVVGVGITGLDVFKSDMCGQCTFGEAKMIAPEKWNE